jgi:hypothetical protein
MGELLQWNGQGDQNRVVSIRYPHLGESWAESDLAHFSLF